MSMTFLQLASRLRQECGVAGTGPTTVIGQTGELKRLVDWIADADEEIQQEHNDWRFMAGSFSITAVNGTASYLPAAFTPAVTNFRDVRQDTVNVYLTSRANESRLRFMDYQTWFDTYNTGEQTTGRPVHYTIGNDQSIKLGQTPDAAYTITGEYQKTAARMTVDADTPIYPAEFHMLPVYLAMMKYGRFTAANEVFSDGERLYKKMLARMKRTQLSAITLAGALA